MASALRLSPAFRYSLYAVFAALFLSGAAWFVADRLKDTADGEFWQQTAATLLMIHGGGAMVTLLLLGALVPIYLRYGWRRRTNLATGIAMAAVCAILIVTAFGLYYLGSETVRPVMSNVHLWLGLASPVLLVGHIWWGRGREPRPMSAFPGPRPGG